ncbi:MAG: TIGR01212 family radical SAM protein [Clostridia bacterium]|nr:TIGR01212 family radical SAM protein [Clostridia bacterium]
MNYRNLRGYLREKYGGRIGKICIDGGFTCPNRDGKCGTGGCIYCTGRGSGEHITEGLPIGEQVRAALARGKSDGYIAYFQNFTNTYAPPSVLKEKYDAALTDRRIVALAVGTRPDCIDREITELIASYKARLDVWVELGLQTASDGTARIINRGYKTEVFTSAVRQLHSYGIPVVAHMIIGLPGESPADDYRTAELFNSLGVFGVKIHSLYIPRGTELEKMYLKGEYTPLTLDEYASRAAGVIARLRPDTVLHRITGDCPSDLLVAPEWNADKNAVIAKINERLSALGGQGALA